MAELVFIHGAADSGVVWGHQVAHFEGAHRVLAVDLPGHGDRLAEVAFDRVDRSAKEVRRLIQAAGLAAPVLVGHSMGGAIALALALGHPGMPRALVLVGSGARLRMRPETIEEARLRAAAAPPGVVAPRLITLERVVSPAASEDARGWLAEHFGQSTAQAAHADFLATHTFDVMGRLREIAVPTLVVGGEDDLWTPPKFQRYLAEHVPNARLILMSGVGHYPFVEAADAFNRALETFLAGLGGTKGRDSIPSS